VPVALALPMAKLAALEVLLLLGLICLPWVASEDLVRMGITTGLGIPRKTVHRQVAAVWLVLQTILFMEMERMDRSVYFIRG